MLTTTEMFVNYIRYTKKIGRAHIKNVERFKVKNNIKLKVVTTNK